MPFSQSDELRIGRSGIKHFYEPRSVGIVYSLDAASGKTIWSFNTVPTPKRGTYRFVCDPHATIMKGVLRVA